MASKKFPEAESDGTATQPRLVPYPRPVLKESVPTPAAATAAAAVVVAASAAAAAAAATGPGTECTLAAEAGGDRLRGPHCSGAAGELRHAVGANDSEVEGW